MSIKKNSKSLKNESPHSSRIVFITEDDKFTLFLIQKTLSLHGYKHNYAMTGKETLEKLSKIKEPVLLLLDYELPDMKGKDLIMKAKARNLTFPFIVITAHQHPTIAVEMMKLGALDYIIKEEGFSELVLTVLKNAFRQLDTQEVLLKTEKAKEESEVRYKELFHSITSGVAVLKSMEKGKDFQFLEFNNTAEKIDQISKKLVIGKNLTSVFPGFKETGLLAVLKKVWKTGKAEKYPATFYQDRRIAGWREYYVYKLPSDEIVMIYDDVSLRKSQEEALRKQNEFLHTILESIKHPFYVLNISDYKVLMANTYAKKKGLNNLSQCYTINHSRITPCDGSDHPCPIREIKKSKKPHIVEHVHYDKDGTARNLEVHGHPIFDEKGNVVQLIEYILDITERRRLEREIIEISQEERNKIGQDLHDSLGQQLAGIAFLTEVLEKRLHEISETEALHISKISRLISGAIEQTRFLARGLSPVEMEPNGFITALERLIENINSVFGIAGSLKTYGHALIHDNKVATQLFYIAQEAINNAVKHSKAKNILVSLTFDKDTIKLEVNDDGIGISGSMNGKNGLGLRIMHYRARLIGAILTIEKKQKFGTRIHCLLNY
jgi:signal transduction histidine kinase/DNA-binding response OmpR family regulator